MLLVLTKCFKGYDKCFRARTSVLGLGQVFFIFRTSAFSYRTSVFSLRKKLCYRTSVFSLRTSVLS